MDPRKYLDTVASNRRTHGFDVVDDETNGFDPVWKTRDDDASVGDVVVLATVVTDPDPDPTTVTSQADEFRDVLVDRIDDQPGSTTPLGYVVFPVPGPDSSLVDAAQSYTVARRRTNVFPLVYDCERERLHSHEVPRLKGRGIYRRQVEDAERLFDT